MRHTRLRLFFSDRTNLIAAPVIHASSHSIQLLRMRLDVGLALHLHAPLA